MPFGLAALPRFGVALALHCCGMAWRISRFVMRSIKPAAAHARILRTPSAAFEGLEEVGFGYAERFVGVQCNGVEMRMHYLDEGPQDAENVIVCLHGEPAWCFLYRKLIPILTKAGHRVICPDFIGFGKSDKFSDVNEYSHAMHTSTLCQLFTQLDLHNVTMVVQDWGGLTGLSAAKTLDDRLANLVIMNTGLPPHTSAEGLTALTRANFLVWRSYVYAMETSLDIAKVFGTACKDLDPRIVKAYAAPFPSAPYKAGAAAWPLLVPLSGKGVVAKDMRATRAFLSTWTRPFLVMFSDKCPVTAGLDRFFAQLIPSTKRRQITVRRAGHFLQEDKGEDLATNINKFIKDMAAKK